MCRGDVAKVNWTRCERKQKGEEYSRGTRGGENALNASLISRVSQSRVLPFPESESLALGLLDEPAVLFCLLGTSLTRMVCASSACRRDGIPSGSLGASREKIWTLAPCVTFAVKSNGGEASIATCTHSEVSAANGPGHFEHYVLVARGLYTYSPMIALWRAMRHLQRRPGS